MDLTEHQREVFEQLVEWYNDTDSDRPFLCLKGSAGTGKSFLAAYFSAFASVGGNVMVTATTNSARRDVRIFVMQRPYIQEKCRKVNRFSGRSIEGMTIYRLLNLKVENDEDRIIIQQKKSYSEEKLYNLVVVDESSMVGDDIFDKIISSRRSLKMLLRALPVFGRNFITIMIFCGASALSITQNTPMYRNLPYILSPSLALTSILGT